MVKERRDERLRQPHCAPALLTALIVSFAATEAAFSDTTTTSPPSDPGRRNENHAAPARVFPATAAAYPTTTSPPSDPGRRNENHAAPARVFSATAAGSASSVLPPDSSAAVAALVTAVSEAEISASMKRLGEFFTRHTYSEKLDPADSMGLEGEDRKAAKGIGAARRWVAQKLRSASPRLVVSFDTHRVAPRPPRLPEELTLHNVIAVLPGATPEGRKRSFLISAHYDSVSADADGTIHWDRFDRPAPGVNDDGSGTAVLLEAARVLSSRDYDANLIFAVFTGEEQGLVGSALYARKARESGMRIDGVLNNDIVGGEIGGDGRVDNRTLRVFSEGPEDSPSRELARLAGELAGKYLPSLALDLVFRHDRFGRGGDHISFNQVGYAGIRFTVSNEDYSRQHTVRDTFDAVSPAYAARVARANIAVLADLALAPSAPVVTDDRGNPTIDRGESGYDARLRWKSGGETGDLAGYLVLARETTAPFWQRTYWAGKADQFVLPGVPIDRTTFGVRAVDREGHMSLASVYIYPARPRPDYTELPLN